MKSTMDELRYFNEKFPRKALERAIENQEETTEILLNELDEMIEHPESTVEDEDYFLYFYAFYLLAQFREKEGFPRILKLISMPPDRVDAMFGDLITEDLNSIIYSTFDGRLEELETVIENPKVDLFVRGAVLDAYGKLYTDGRVSKEAFIQYLRKLLATEPDDSENDIAILIQGIIIDRKLFELIDDVQALYDVGRIDENFFGLYDSFIDYMYDYSNDQEQVYFIDNIVDEIYQWAMFEKTKEEEIKNEKHFQKAREKLEQENQNVPKDKKIGRNEPCPCGSGKKYKKCCLKKENIYKEKQQEPIAVQERWLKKYPIIEGDGKEESVRLSDKFDQEAIEIDRLVYLALHRRTRPMVEPIDYSKEEVAKASYLIDAFEHFKAKNEKETIRSFEEYDQSHKIHYRSKDWVEELHKKLASEEVISIFGDRTEEVEVFITQFVD